MVQPVHPWPKPTSHDDMLSELVAAGDIGKVRDYFDQVFWEGRKERPEWPHLRLALLREDRAMLKLLHTWGAKPTEAQLASFKEAARDKFPAYVKLLRAAGLRPENTVWEELTLDPAKPTPDEIKERAFQLYAKSGCIDGRDVDNWLKAEQQLIAERRAALERAAEADALLFEDASFKKDTDRLLEKIPQEWRLVLKSFQAAGAGEAVIAGGALRDLFNSRQIKDVDIFLRTQGGRKKNKKFIQAAFDAAGIEVQEQTVGYDYGSAIKAKFPEPNTSSEKKSTTQGVTRETEMEAWKIIAGPRNTEYNIIFVNDNLDRKLSSEALRLEQRSVFAGGLLDSFDIGLCQIACDGDSIVSTAAYKDDVKHRRISLLRPNASSEDHLQRVVKKYPEWQLNTAAHQALLPKPKPAPRRSSGYGWY